jgi:hypothetical protein
MKNTTYKLLALFAFAATLTTACEDRIELDLPKGEILTVAQGWLTNDDRPHDFRLNFSQEYFDSSAPPPLSGATVILRDSDGLETVLAENTPGVYTYPQGGEPGKSYQVEITLPDGKHYLSDFEVLREPVEIVDIRWGISSRGPSDFLEEEPEQIYEVVIDTFEPQGFGDFYRWRLIVNGVEQDSPQDLNIASDEFVDGNPIFNFEPFFQLFFLGDTVTIIQERITNEAYSFLLLVQTQTAFVGGPFDTPPAPIPGNVRNLLDDKRNALGYLGTSGRSSATVIVGE